MIVSFIILIALIALLVYLIRHRESASFVICPNPNCGFRGKVQQTGSSSGCLLLVLLVFGVLPGILYLLFCGSPGGVICPKCGMRIR